MDPNYAWRFEPWQHSGYDPPSVADEVSSLQRRRLSSALTGLPAHLLGGGLRRQAEQRTLQHLGRARRAAEAYRPHLRAAATAALATAKERYQKGRATSVPGASTTGSCGHDRNPIKAGSVAASATGHHAGGDPRLLAPLGPVTSDSPGAKGAHHLTAMPAGVRGHMAPAGFSAVTASPVDTASDAEARQWQALYKVTRLRQARLAQLAEQREAQEQAALEQRRRRQEWEREQRAAQLQRRGHAGAAGRRQAGARQAQAFQNNEIEQVEAQVARDREVRALGLLLVRQVEAVTKVDEDDLVRRLLRGTPFAAESDADGEEQEGQGEGQPRGAGGEGAAEGSTAVGGGGVGHGVGGSGVAVLKPSTMLQGMHLEAQLPALAAADPGCDPGKAGLPGRVLLLLRVLVECWAGAPGVHTEPGARSRLLRAAVMLAYALVAYYGAFQLTYMELQVLAFLLTAMHSHAGTDRISGTAPSALFSGAHGPFSEGLRAALTSAAALSRVARRAAAMTPGHSATAIGGCASRNGNSGADGAAGATGEAAAVTVETPMPKPVQAKLMQELAEVIVNALYELRPTDPWSGTDQDDPWVTAAAVLRRHADGRADVWRRRAAAGAASGTSGASSSAASSRNRGQQQGRRREGTDGSGAAVNGLEQARPSGWGVKAYTRAIIEALEWLPDELVEGGRHAVADAAAAATAAAAPAPVALDPPDTAATAANELATAAAATATGGACGKEAGRSHSRSAEEEKAEKEGLEVGTEPLVLRSWELGRVAPRNELARTLWSSLGLKTREVFAVGGGAMATALTLAALMGHFLSDMQEKLCGEGESDLGGTESSCAATGRAPGAGSDGAAGEGSAGDSEGDVGDAAAGGGSCGDGGAAAGGGSEVCGVRDASGTHRASGPDGRCEEAELGEAFSSHVLYLLPESSEELCVQHGAPPSQASTHAAGASPAASASVVRLVLGTSIDGELRRRVRKALAGLAADPEKAVRLEASGATQSADEHAAARDRLGQLLASERAAVVQLAGRDGAAGAEAALLLLAQLRAQTKQAGRELAVLPVVQAGEGQRLARRLPQLWLSLGWLHDAVMKKQEVIGEKEAEERARRDPSFRAIIAAARADAQNSEGPLSYSVFNVHPHWNFRYPLALNRSLCGWLGLLGSGEGALEAAAETADTAAATMGAEASSEDSDEDLDEEEMRLPDPVSLLGLVALVVLDLEDPHDPSASGECAGAAAPADAVV